LVFLVSWRWSMDWDLHPMPFTGSTFTWVLLLDRGVEWVVKREVKVRLDVVGKRLDFLNFLLFILPQRWFNCGQVVVCKLKKHFSSHLIFVFWGIEARGIWYLFAEWWLGHRDLKLLLRLLLPNTIGHVLLLSLFVRLETIGHLQNRVFKAFGGQYILLLCLL
jgi:hypothetical protein